MSLKPCGTTAAYQRHRRRGEKPCQPCKDAHSARSKAYKRSGSTARGNLPTRAQVYGDARPKPRRIVAELPFVMCQYDHHDECPGEGATRLGNAVSGRTRIVNRWVCPCPCHTPGR